MQPGGERGGGGGGYRNDSALCDFPHLLQGGGGQGDKTSPESMITGGGSDRFLSQQDGGN